MKEWLNLLLKSLVVGIFGALLLLIFFPELGGETLFHRLIPQTPQFEYKTTYADAVEKAAPAVVIVGTRTLEARGLGSGVFIDNEGHIVTNYHVVQNATDIRVALSDGIPMTAQLVGVDVRTDLAVLKVDKKNLNYLALTEAPPARVGDLVLAIGYPIGVGQSATIGIVSATEQMVLKPNNLVELFQTDAAINKGNSGGALINAKGQLIGISSAYLSSEAEGINFGIPVSLVKFVVEHIIRDGKVIRGWMGVKSGGPLSLPIARTLGLVKVGGILIEELFENSPATKAGLQVGDIILRVNGAIVGDYNRFIQWLSKMEPDTPLVLEVMRPDLKNNNHQNFQVSLVLETQPSESK